MSFESDLYEKLRDDATITTLVSGRIYPNTSPQNPTTPYIVYARDDNESEEDMVGGSGLDRTSLQFDIYAAEDKHEDTVAIREALVALLQPFVGTMGAGNTQVRSVEYTNDFDLYEDDTKLHHNVLLMAIWHDV